ncbi:hypothetical protein BaRGS_00005216 [Batillaria attramentaria]|uniref:Ig-like domain-containing protein n=1 Tax=Batillaria attramentaria TaxID=370345 RepID=A0ABD0LWD8_9CAEN
MSFTITPNTFVAAVTPTVSMRCDVADSGSELSQLLLIQVEVQDRGNMVPMVTLTPGTAPKIMESGLEKQLSVDGSISQFLDIGKSYLSVGYSFPGIDVAGNYTCVVSGLSTSGLLVRFSETATLSVGGASNASSLHTPL